MCRPGPRSVTSRRIVRTYSGTALGGTTPEASASSGSGPLMVSMMTVSPELMVSTGLSAALKCPTWTVCGLGISVYSAASALGNASADKSKLQIDSVPILALASSPFFRVLPQRLVIKYEAILNGVPGRRIRTSSFCEGALFRASSMDDPRKTIVSLDATRFGIKSVVPVALPGELFLDGPGLRPHRRIFDRDFIFERGWPSAGPTLNEV